MPNIEAKIQKNKNIFESRKITKQQEIAPKIHRNHPLEYVRKNDISSYQYKPVDNYIKAKHENKSKFFMYPLTKQIRFKPRLGGKRIIPNSKKTIQCFGSNNPNGKEKLFNNIIGQNKKLHMCKEQNKSLAGRLRDIFFQTISL